MYGSRIILSELITLQYSINRFQGTVLFQIFFNLLIFIIINFDFIVFILCLQQAFSTSRFQFLFAAIRQPLSVLSKLRLKPSQDQVPIHAHLLAEFNVYIYNISNPNILFQDVVCIPLHQAVHPQEDWPS